MTNTIACSIEGKKERARIADKKWRLANPEKVRAARKKWRQFNPEKERNNQKKWRTNNPDKVKEIAKKKYMANRENALQSMMDYYQMNREKIIAAKKKYYLANSESIKTKAKTRRLGADREKIAEYNRMWRKANPDKSRLIKQKRRALQKNQLGVFSLEDWKGIKRRFNNTCPACGRSEPAIKLEMDHIVPLSKGGRHDKNNIQPLCRNCNSRKRTYIRKWNPRGQMELLLGEK